MKKSLIALAVASAVSAPAFAATSNVDVYGKLHVSVSWLNDQATTAEDIQVSSNASRIGFKGTEDLGGGLAAIWQLESGVNIDEQNGTFASRNSYVGLKGGWGTALVGNHDTPLKLVGRAVDLFGDTMADSRNVTGIGSDTRAKNVVAYISPDFSGFSFAAAYSSDFPGSSAASAADSADHSVYNLNATYTNGPLFLGVAYGDGDGHEMAGLGQQWRVAGGFTFGNFKVVGQYDQIDDNNTIASKASVLAGDADAWMVGASYTMGAMVFKANYMEASVDAPAGVVVNEPKQWTIGMDYNLSKRTTVYALYADGEYVTFGSGANDSDWIAPATKDSSILSLGMMHSF